jgi:hypothetical protein
LPILRMKTIEYKVVIRLDSHDRWTEKMAIL